MFKMILPTEQLPCLYHDKSPPQHDAASIISHSKYDVFRLFDLDLSKKELFWSEHRFPHDYNKLETGFLWQISAAPPELLWRSSLIKATMLFLFCLSC